MSSAIKTKNFLYTVIVLAIIIVASFAINYIYKQNKEYARLNQIPSVKEEFVETGEEELSAEIEIPAAEEARDVRGDTGMKLRSGDDILIF